MSTIEKIKSYYRSRNSDFFKKWHKKNFLFYQFASFYRELLYHKILKNKYEDFAELKFLEIGAGSGYNLYFFQKIGFRSENMFANELLEERIKELKANFPAIKILAGDAREIDKSYRNYFDVILQSTVFSSIPDREMRKQLAQKMFDMLKDNGVILWYDFFISNPFNNFTTAIKRKEIKMLFSNARRIRFYRTTLASPIARRIGTLYPLFNAIPFLRTHFVCAIER